MRPFRHRLAAPIGPLRRPVRQKKSKQKEKEPRSPARCTTAKVPWMESCGAALHQTLLPAVRDWLVAHQPSTPAITMSRRIFGFPVSVHLPTTPSNSNLPTTPTLPVPFTHIPCPLNNCSRHIIIPCYSNCSTAIIHNPEGIVALIQYKRNPNRSKLTIQRD